MFMQRFIERLPAGGEIVIFDRSWYNRAGVEYVMGFCSPKQHERFLELCPLVEKFVIDGGIRLIKIWLEVGQEEQKRRFMARIEDPVRQWKLSPMDLESYKCWYDYSRARDVMLVKDFELLLNEAARKAPLGELVDIMDVGFACAYLATPFAHRITGGTVYVDGGANIVA